MNAPPRRASPLHRGATEILTTRAQFDRLAARAAAVSRVTTLQHMAGRADPVPPEGNNDPARFLTHS